MPQNVVNISDEVADALARNHPVVALESTIITHGMAYPHNLETALGVEQVIRDAGATPATIAIVDGVPGVGVSGQALERLAAAGQKSAKASRRDIAALMVLGKSAGTTVATTMQIAALAKISVFATGGIGGVHRGGEHSFDISADLMELAHTPVAVVCAGAKSILDIGKTLEVLETHGVPVIGYGTDRFPAFFTPDSGHMVDYRFDSPEEIAALIIAQARLGMTNGILIGNPVPEDDAQDAEKIEAIISKGIEAAASAGVTGKQFTPFMLETIAEMSGGDSLRTNIALIRNNALVAARIAGALCRARG
ncbi:MAG: pseudouridine-5'-phosphate glycosidase [Alphaproteobacteria bacterium]|nr:pseudouridine-5'-phosphate glycosidase [Alphaproteobacteria bacterium]